MRKSRFAQELSRASTVGTASQLRDQGVTKSDLRTKDWRRVGRGLYLPNTQRRKDPKSSDPAPSEATRESTAQRILNCRPLLTAGAVLGGWAAAYVLGADWLDGIDPWTFELLPIDIVSCGRRRHRELIRFRYARREPAVVTKHGIGVTAPLQTALDGARWAESVEEALAFMDAMVDAKIISPQTIVQHLDRMRSLHGLDQAREATRLVRSNVWSPWESRLRYCYRVEAGLPEPMLNVRLFNDEGLFLGNPDLFDPEAALAVEFDGQQHRDREQHRRDNIREERFESVNVTTVRADSLDMRRSRRASLILRMIDGHRRGMRRDRRYDRWLIDPRAWS